MIKTCMRRGGLALFLLLGLTQLGFAGTIWTGNDSCCVAYHTDTSGNVLGSVSNVNVSGVAWDGANLWFSSTGGTLTKRTPNGQTVLQTFALGTVGSPTEDLAWDSTRGRLWRIDHNTATLVKINPSGVVENTYGVSGLFGGPSAFAGNTRGGLGIAYNPNTDQLYVSFCPVGCASLGVGLVIIVDPNTGLQTSELFRTTGFATGGLGYDPLANTLWVGDSTVVRNMSLSGAVLGSFNRPLVGGVGFADGLEFVGAAVPEPAAAGLLLVGLVGILAARWRKLRTR